jgi:hypothetical protein
VSDAGRLPSIATTNISLQTIVDCDKRLDELSTARVIGEAAEAIHKLQKNGQPVGTLTPLAIVVSSAGVRVDAPVEPTTAYCAPERLRGQPGDRRSDVFSLGIVLWEALAHTRLFTGATDDDAKKAVLEKDVRAPSEHNANVPAELDAICKKALARDPADRYQSTKVMAAEISAVLDDANYPDNNEQIAKYLEQTFPAGAAKPVMSAGANLAAKLAAAPASSSPAPAASSTKSPFNQTTLGMAPLKDPHPDAPQAPAKDAPAAKREDLSKTQAMGSLVSADLLAAVDKKPEATVEAKPEAKSEVKVETKVEDAAPVAAAPLTPSAPIVSGAAPAGKRNTGQKAAVSIASAETVNTPVLVPTATSSKQTDTPKIAGLPAMPPGASLAATDPQGEPVVKDTKPDRKVDAPTPVETKSEKTGKGKKNKKRKRAQSANNTNAKDTKPEATVEDEADDGDGDASSSDAALETKDTDKDLPTEAKEAAKDTAKGVGVVDAKEPASRPSQPAVDPRDAVSLPSPRRAKSETGEMLGGWGWSDTDEPAADSGAYDDDIDEEKVRRKRLVMAIGGALGVLGLIIVIALAAGGDSKKKADGDKANVTAGPSRTAAEPTPSPSPGPAPEPEPEPVPDPNAGSAQVAAVDPNAGSADPNAGSAAAAVDPAAAKAEEERLAKEAAEKEAAAKAEAERLVKEQAEQEKAAKAEAERLAKEQADKEKAAKAEEARLAKEAADKAKLDEAAKAKAAKAEADRLAKEQAAKDKAAKAEAERLAKEQAAKEKAAKAEAARVAKANEPKPAPVAEVKKPEPKKPEPKKPEPKKAEPKKVAAAAPIDPYAESTPKVDPATAYKAGFQQYVRGDTSGALATFKGSQAANPSYAPTYRGLGMVYEKMGNKAQAKSSFKRYLQLSPKADDADQIRERMEKL